MSSRGNQIRANSKSERGSKREWKEEIEEYKVNCKVSWGWKKVEVVKDMPPNIKFERQDNTDSLWH